MGKKVLITDTILRDAHQSQAATRMRTDEMVPMLEKLNKAGTGHLKCGAALLLIRVLDF